MWRCLSVASMCALMIACDKPREVVSTAPVAVSPAAIAPYVAPQQDSSAQGSASVVAPPQLDDMEELDEVSEPEEPLEKFDPSSWGTHATRDPFGSHTTILSAIKKPYRYKTDKKKKDASALVPGRFDEAGHRRLAFEKTEAKINALQKKMPKKK